MSDAPAEWRQVWITGYASDPTSRWWSEKPISRGLEYVSADAMKAQIDAAVKAERERCAQVAETCPDSHWGPWVAAAIRRGGAVMKQMPFKGWAVFSCGLRTEWPIPHTIRHTRREAIQAWWDEVLLRNEPYELAHKTWHDRIADGSIRIGKIVCHAAPLDGEQP